MRPLRRQEPLRRFYRPRCELLEDRAVPSTAKFAVIGDYGNGSVPEETVANLVKSWGPDFITTVGDNNYGEGTAAAFDANIGQFYGAYITSDLATNRFWPSLGNHDWLSPPYPNPGGAQAYLDYFTLPGNERYYNLVRGPVELFVVDSDPNEPDGTTSSSIQGAWLQTALGNSTAPWKIVVSHHPPYSSGSHGSSTGMRWPFAEWGATAVLSGHDHDYERLNVNGFPYFVNGVGGQSVRSFGTTDPHSQVRYNSTFGAMKVEASDTQLTFQFFSIASPSGTLIDTYTLTRSSFPSAAISESGGATSVAEGGATDTYTVTLTQQPVGDVIVSLTPDSQVDVSAGSMTFTPTDWNIPQTVTVTARDDSVAEGNHTGAISHSATSSDAAYNGITIASVTAGIADNDVAGAVVSESGGSTSVAEGGTTDTYTVVLTRQPAADVTVSPVSSSQLGVAPTALTFTTTDWNTPQTVTVTAVDDGVAEGSHTGAITHTASSGDPAYDGITIPGVMAGIADNDVAAPTTLVPKRSTWTYVDNGSNQGTAWRGAGVNDSVAPWKSGPAELGFGDGGERTTIASGRITYYFRHAFTVADRLAYSALTLRLLRDDGGVVYLNGTEVFRSNMPSGTIAFGTLASSTVGGADESTNYYAAAVNPNLLVNGTNVLAVEIHQSSSGSSDVSFDAELTGTTTGPPPPSNTPPTISDIADQSTSEDVATPVIPFTVGDAETAPASLTVSGTSTDATLVPPANIVFGGSGANRTVTVTPAPDQSGTATITVTVNDGTTTRSDTFLLNVSPVNDPPTAVNNTYVVNSGGTLNIAAPGVLANDSDAEGNPLTAELVTPSQGSLELRSDGSFTYQHNGTGSADSFTYLARDSARAPSGTATVTIAIQTPGTTETRTFQDGVSPTSGYAGTRDTEIRKDSSSRNFGTAKTLAADGSPLLGALLRWDLGGIPQGSSVQAVTLTLNVTNSTSDAYEIYRLKRDWHETQATWSVASSGNSWQTPGGAQGANDRDGTVLGSITGSSGSRTFTLNSAGIAAVQMWVNDPTSNFGLITQDYTSASDGLAFSSSEASTKSQRPKLSVTYVTMTTTSAIAATTLATPLLTSPAGATTDTYPTFTWAAVDQATHYGIWVNDLTTGESQVLRDREVNGTSWTAAVALNDGHTYRWWVQALSADNNAGPWSAPLDFTVDVVPFTIYGALFEDVNANGVQEMGENGLTGFTVFLDSNRNRVLDADETSTLSDADGYYVFRNLVPGTYQVWVADEPGWQRTTPDMPEVAPPSTPPPGGCACGLSAVCPLVGLCRVP